VGAGARRLRHRALRRCHLRLRTKARDLFTTRTSADLVAEAFDGPLDTLTTRLRAGETVDIADTSRVLVGRMLATCWACRRTVPTTSSARSSPRVSGWPRWP
jgi:hypothetical protein